MSLKDTFCPSPWIHMRITNSGTYEPCRWMTKNGPRVDFDANIQKITPLNYFHNHMAQLRHDLLQGKRPDICNDCHVMEQHGKVSGRQRQLLKVGVLENYFEKSLLSSPLQPSFDHSNMHNGKTNRTVTDWQIDLGNYCNGSCVFCSPESSSSLATEFKKIGLIDQLPPLSWCDDPDLLNKFVDDLNLNPAVKYLHFIGGETVITPGFKKILQAMVNSGLSQQVTIGFTTNLTVWSDAVVELLEKFQQVNLGMSLETLTSINDYVRYPSQLELVKKTLDRWVSLGNKHNWLMQLRPTPTCLTVHDLSTVYEYAWHNNLAVESCNFIDRPAHMRISVLPKAQREQACHTLRNWIQQHPVGTVDQIINTRDPNMAQKQIVQDANSYLSYLESAPDESYRLPDLMSYLKILESNRGNKILQYLPQYEQLFRSQGY